MGEVYEAEHLETRRRVAVKLLRPRLAEREEHRRRFEREARAAGRIDHHNVCEVLDCGTDEGGALYLVMPLLRGEPLTDRIARDAPLPFDFARDVATQVLDALAAAHDTGLVHRDLKPDNLFLVSGGADAESVCVKILDFGISKVEAGDGEDDAKTLTRTGAVLGTPYYMAPEQAQGIKDLDARVDLYATGVVLYEMVTGTRPIDGASAPELFWKLWNVPVTPPRALRPDISPPLEALILRAMARNREERFQTARAMSEALTQVVTTVSAEGSRSGHVASPVVLSCLSSWPDTLALPDAAPAPARPGALDAETVASSEEAEADVTPRPAARPRPPRRRARRVDRWVGPVLTAVAIAAMAATGVWVAARERGATRRESFTSTSTNAASAVRQDASPEAVDAQPGGQALTSTEPPARVTQEARPTTRPREPRRAASSTPSPRPRAPGGGVQPIVGGFGEIP